MQFFFFWGGGWGGGREGKQSVLLRIRELVCIYNFNKINARVRIGQRKPIIREASRKS